MAQRPHRKRPDDLRGLLIAMAVAALAAGILLALVVASAATREQIQTTVIAGICLVALIGAFWFAIDQIRTWRQDLQRMRGALLLAENAAVSFASQVDGTIESNDLSQLASTLDHVLQKRQARLSLAEERLTSVLAALPAAMLVVTDRGLVSLVNAAAKQILPTSAIAPGTSVYAALRRDSLSSAVRNAMSQQHAVTTAVKTTDDRELQATIALMHTSGGFVAMFEGVNASPYEEEVEYDLSLHDVLPQAESANPDTPLDDLPLLVFDCETTGLDPAQDRIVSIGAVLAHGGRVFVHENRDTLVKPDIPIPVRSTAIHGIDDAMVADAGNIGEELAWLADTAAGRVVLGHNIGFDLALLEAEAKRKGVPWKSPLSLDTGQLVAALEPGMEQLDLDHVAGRYGVDIVGRHTALGDALVAADLFGKLIPLLQDRGVTTLGEAWVFSRKASGLRGRQARAGWHAVGEGG